MYLLSTLILLNPLSTLSLIICLHCKSHLSSSFSQPLHFYLSSVSSHLIFIFCQLSHLSSFFITCHLSSSFSQPLHFLSVFCHLLFYSIFLQLSHLSSVFITSLPYHLVNSNFVLSSVTSHLIFIFCQLTYHLSSLQVSIIIFLT